jgi:hypothetical protein
VPRAAPLVLVHGQAARFLVLADFFPVKSDWTARRAARLLDKVSRLGSTDLSVPDRDGGVVGGGGRRAALPDDGWQPPARLLVDEQRVVVRFTSEDGRAWREFDFARLPVGRELQVAFARGFERWTGPGGTRKTVESARCAFGYLRPFATYLAGLPTPPRRPGELAASHLDGYLLQRRHLRGFMFEFLAVKATLAGVEGLSDRFAAKLAETQVTRPGPPVALASYSQAEFRRILTAARQDVRAVATRIRAHRELLERWRGGEIDRGTQRARWELGMILDHVERVGDVPRYGFAPRPPRRWLTRHGTVNQLVSLLHLHWQEAAAFLVLLIGLTGQNGGTIADAPAAHHRPDGEAGGTATAIVGLRKPRRGRRRSHMDVALADLPDWLGIKGVRPDAVTAREELHTPFGVYMLLRELTGPARRIVGTDRLFVFWVGRGSGGGGLRVGALDDMVARWGGGKGLTADPAGPDAAALAGPEVASEPLQVTMPRLRLSFLQHHQKAVAHTDQVLASEYLGRDRGNLLDYQRLVARVLAEQVAKAKASTLLATLTQADIAEARERPAAVAARFGLDAAVLKRVLGGELDTVLAACVDHTGGPMRRRASRAGRRSCAVWTAPARAPPPPTCPCRRWCSTGWRPAGPSLRRLCGHTGSRCPTRSLPTCSAGSPRPWSRPRGPPRPARTAAWSSGSWTGSWTR